MKYTIETRCDGTWNAIEMPISPVFRNGSMLSGKYAQALLHSLRDAHKVHEVDVGDGKTKYEFVMRNIQGSDRVCISFGLAQVSNTTVNVVEEAATKKFEEFMESFERWLEYQQLYQAIETPVYCDTTARERLDAASAEIKKLRDEITALSARVNVLSVDTESHLHPMAEPKVIHAHEKIEF